MNRIVRVLSVGSVLFVGCLLFGCAVPMVERQTAAEYVQRGFERSARNPEMLIQTLPTDAALAKAGIVAKPLALSINDAAWTSHALKMFLATTWDYVVLPIGGSAAAIYGGTKLMSASGGGDRAKTTIINAPNNGSQVIMQNGSGNSGGQAGPATTTTTSSGGP